jgi:hypothetical protein
MRVFVPDRRNLKGRFELAFDFARIEEMQCADTIDALLDPIALVAQRGAFRADSAKASVFRIADRAIRDLQLTYSLDLDAVDPRFVELLRAALAQNQAFLPERLSLLPPPGDATPLRELAWPDDDDPYMGTPVRISEPIFPVTIDATITSRMRRAVVVMAGLQQARDVERLADWLAPLGELLEAGAFCLPSAAPGEAISTFGGVQIFEENSIEIIVDRFDANEAFFDVLVNCLDTYARAGHPIHQLELF